MCKKAIVFSGLLFLSSILFAQSPGGIPDQSFWLQGNFSLNGMDMRTLNFNPAISLQESKTRIKLPASIESLRRVTIFTVYQNPGTNDERPVWEMTGNFEDLLLSNRQISSTSGKTNIIFVKNKPARAEAFIHTYFGNTPPGSPADNAEQIEAAIRFGQANSRESTNTAPGLISEFILYERILTEDEINAMETYLALKYGITVAHNYLNASGDIVWNWKNDQGHSNNIAGIARDDKATLYQKQSTSSNTPGQLVIGVDKIALSNNVNTGVINDNDYLIWGDNAQALALQENAENAEGEMLLSQKNWLMKRSGISADKLSTTLQADARPLLAGKFAKDELYLIIDRSGTGNFVADNCTYVKPDGISDEGIASFKGVYWDTDGSGKDAFAFGVKPAALQVKKNNKDAATLVSFQLYPNPVTDGRYKIAITLDKVADIQVKVYDIHQRLVHSGKGAGQSSYLFPGFINGAAGTYTVKVITPDTEYSRIIIVQ